MKQFCVLSFLILFLTGCETTQQVQVSPHEVLHDHVFPDYTIYKIETQEQVFALNDEAKAFVDRAINPIFDPIDRMETLIRKIFDRSEFNLLYMGSANTTAAETFDNRAANCLSMSIMTYALAREAGFSVKFQDIKIPEYWTRREGYSLLNGHVNLQIFPRAEANIIHLFSSGLQVDFDPQRIRNNFPKRNVDINTVLAMFYNNKGADALVSNSYTKAYAYFREAIKMDPHFDSTYVNLGILYRIHEQYAFAEDSYRQGLLLDPDNLTAWENLAYLYEVTGNTEEAQTILARVSNYRQDNPFYHFILGEQEFDNENWLVALEHYRDALRLDKSSHEIYFGLAKTYFQLGDVTRSKRYFEKAKMKSRSGQDQEKYQGKLDLLSRL